MAGELLEQRIVLWQASGDLHAMRDQCPHRGTRLSLGEIRDGSIVCPYHGWRFDARGRCTLQPAQPGVRPSAGTRVETFRVREAYGLVWVCPGVPEYDLPEFRGLNGDYHRVVTGPYDVCTSAPRVVENFLDMAHLPFVHAGMLGDEAHAEIAEYEVSSDDDGVKVRNFRIWQPNASSVHTEGMEVVYSYDILRPYTVMLTKRAVEENKNPVILSSSPSRRNGNSRYEPGSSWLPRTGIRRRKRPCTISRIEYSCRTGAFLSHSFRKDCLWITRRKNTSVPTGPRLNIGAG